MEALAPLVQSAEQAAHLAAAAHRSRIAAPGASLCVPLFATSAVTGASLQLLHSFLNSLQPAAGGEGMQGWCQPALRALSGAAAAGQGSTGATHFQIDSSFEVADVGTGKHWSWSFLAGAQPAQMTLCPANHFDCGSASRASHPSFVRIPFLVPAVYSGTVVCGTVKLGDELLLGPLEGGRFRRVVVSGIHRSRVEVQAAQQGQHATLAVQPLDGCAPDAAAGGEETAAAAEGAAALLGSVTAQVPLAQPPPLRADSAGCLHAWMQQACSGAGERGPARPLPPSTPALAIQGRGPHAGHPSLTTSHSAAQLGGLQRLLGSSGELHHAWGSSPQLVSASSGAAPRPRKASCA